MRIFAPRRYEPRFKSAWLGLKIEHKKEKQVKKQGIARTCQEEVASVGVTGSSSEV
jgi:hypothetical protein